jgi:hypothetical protein
VKVGSILATPEETARNAVMKIYSEVVRYSVDAEVLA